MKNHRSQWAGNPHGSKVTAYGNAYILTVGEA